MSKEGNCRIHGYTLFIQGMYYSGWICHKCYIHDKIEDPKREGSGYRSRYRTPLQQIGGNRV